MAEVKPADVNRYLSHKRIVILSAPSRSNPSCQAFIARWRRASEAVEDRDMVLVEIFAEGPNALGGEGLSDEASSLLIERYDIDPAAFEIVLVGKDGTVKSRGRDTSPEDLFALIDTMPMRRAEMEQKKG